MSSRQPDARTRLPREPYPGLRPFLDFESALLFGRERQVREVIERLRDTQFVAVLGGSGSGKSSLVHAGVTPELRSFGIPGAGDLWLTMTCTPGTNVARIERGRPAYTPVTRLAWKFSGLLKSRGSAAADAARIDEIAQVFRQEAGFARLAAAYGDELAVPAGPDPKDARLLFVLDQFEEIFHPTNKDVEDASLLVERVIDHFFNPDPRVFVVLTMRSEHLNDCAGFLELPDAINRSSYLVRRLDEDELRDAIVQPAQRFLRLMTRAAPEAEALPAEVVFEPAVLERLLRDVNALTHDSDHLPLLQHLLARLWQAALEREGHRRRVPAAITQADLARGVGVGAATAPPEERTNTLRASLENWAEASYLRRGPQQQRQFDSVLKRLAFKDPNTGMYTQQRIHVDDATALLGLGHTPADLRALVEDGFIGSVDYLFWDDEDPSRVTLKVSHESLIRGWARLRTLIDGEAERFDEFINALRKCSAWVAHDRDADFLLEAGEIRRLNEADVQAMLANPAERARWFRFVLLDREGTRLARLDSAFDAYLEASRQRLKRSESSAKRKLVGWLVTIALALVLLPSALFSVLIQEPVAQRALLFFEAGNLANATAQAETYADAQAGQEALKTLLEAAALIDRGRSGEADTMSRISEWLLQHLQAIPAVKRQDNLLDGVAALVEPPVNGRLRETLNGWMWKLPAADGRPVPAPTPVPRRCDVEYGATPGEQPNGQLFASSDAGTGARRYLFVPYIVPERDTAVTLRVATFDETGSRCTATQTVMAIPLFLEPRIVLDGSLRFFMFTQTAKDVEVPSLTVHEIDWARTGDGNSRMAGRRQRAVVLDREVIDAVRARVADTMPVVVPTLRTAGGRVFTLGSGHWRIQSTAAQRLDRRDDGPLVPLRPAAPDSPCDVLGASRPRQTDFELTSFEHGSYCITVTLRREGSAPSREVLAAVFARPEAAAPDTMRQRLRARPPAAIATMNQFARVTSEPLAWLAGVRGAYAGWLAMRVRLRNDEEAEIGLPWSTCALAREGASLVGAEPVCEAAAALTVRP
jgi:hypothetical protein